MSSSSFDLALTDVRCFDGRSWLPGLVNIGIRGSRIAAVSQQPLEAGMTIDGRGRFVSPGLIDTHVHLLDFIRATGEPSMEAFLATDLPRRLRQFLDVGVTTIKSLGDAEDDILKVRDLLEDGIMMGPRLSVVGTAFTAPGSHPSSTIYRNNPWYRARATFESDSPEDARTVVRRLAERRVDAIKVLYQGGCRCAGAAPYFWKSRTMNLSVRINRMKRGVLDAIIDESHRASLPVTAHTIEEGSAIAVLDAGVDGLEHGVVDDRLSDERVIDLLLKRDATYVPTLWIHGSTTSYLNLADIARAGVRIAAGTDSFTGHGDFGVNTIVELERMKSAGLSSVAVLKAATANAARHLRRDDLGIIAVGKLADLIVTNTDPEIDFDGFRRPEAVIKGGKVVAGRRFSKLN